MLFYVLHCGFLRDFVPLFGLRVALFGLCVCVRCAALGARDSVLHLDFGNIGFKKESLPVFVSFLGKR